MKYISKLKYVLTAVVVALGLSACDAPFEEITSLDLNRCLEPMNLSAKVDPNLGDVVSFSWDVSKDADSYILTITGGDGGTTETVLPSNVPYLKKLTADQTYYFTVQATADRKQPSKVASYDKAIKTYAVKDNLFLKVSDRTRDAITVTWSKEVDDYLEVTHIDYAYADAEDVLGTVELGEEEKAAASARITGLEPTKEYVITLYYLSASRGQVDVWTAADTEGYTTVETLDALLSAVKTPGAKIALSLAGSPYDIESLEITNGFSIVGCSAADGTKPVIQGEFHVSDAWTAGHDFYFEDVEFNGAGTTASPSGFGFAFQNKNGGTVKDKNVGSLTYKNCVITNYTKGLMYEWGNNMVFGDVVYESCEISNINYDGTVGGDVFDIRQATTVNKLAFVNNTIYQGMRTFVRFDAGTLGALVFENNTLHNLNFVDNTNNAGVFGLQITPGEFSFKNNLIINMTGKAVLAGSNAKYVPASNMGVAAANNWFYNLPVGDDGAVSYFTDNFTLANASGTILDSDPCYNAAGGLFNILATSEIAGKRVGAPKWWTPYVEEPEDLTLNVVEGNHSWNFSNARYFSGTIKKMMVRDQLFINTGESYPIVVDGGMLNFQSSAVTDRKGVPTLNNLQFKVNAPGSLVIKAQDPAGKGAHFVVGVGPVGGGEIALKGGVSAMADSDTPTKILITSITEESMVYIYPSGPISLEQLAWSTDVTPINTALPTPAPKASPASITQGDATDIVISWDPVDNAESYSVVFSGKTATVSDGLEYVIGGTTTGMLDAGSYKVEVYANPGANDLYNTESAAGVAAFAVLPKGGGEQSDEFVVKDITELRAAIDAGKSEITLAANTYDLEGILTVTAPLALKGQDGAKVVGGFKLSGEVGSFSLENLTVEAGGQGNFIEFDNAEGVNADLVSVRNTVIDGFGKSVIYASNTADKFKVSDIVFFGAEVYNHGTGQGVFDLRNGAYGSFKLMESTIVGGRDFLRIDAPCAINEVVVRNNTGYNLNDAGNAGGILCVRATPASYTVSNNLFANIANSISGRTAAMKPVMRGNVWYNIGEKFYTGCIDAELAVAGGGFVLTADPFKDAASGDFTLTNAVVMDVRAGASKWNPSFVSNPGDVMTVSSADEFYAAVGAGKTAIKFAAGSYDLSAEAITLTAGMRLSGEAGAEITVSQLNLAEGDLGVVTLEDLTITGTGSNNLINVSGASVARSLVVRNCVIKNIGKSVFYGNGEGSEFQSVVFSNLVLSGLGGGQGTFDIRKGTIGSLAIEQSTIVGGRDFLRADAGHVTGSVSVVNNTFDGVTLNNGNGILYVRSVPERYVFKNNLFLNENGSNNLLSKASGVTVPTEVAGNFFYNCTSEKFFTGLVTEEIATANGGVILAADPVKDAAAGDYTLTDALCLSSNVGAARWNPNAGRVTTDISVATLQELLNAIDAGKTAITLAYGTYDLTAEESGLGGTLTLTRPLVLSGQAVGGAAPTVIGNLKVSGAEMTELVLDNLRFSGNGQALGCFITVADADVNASRILVRGCEIFGYKQSIIYDNVAGTVANVEFSNNLVHDFGAGQDFFDFRKGNYPVLTINGNTFYNGGRTFLRMDASVNGGSIAVSNNTVNAFLNLQTSNNNGVLHVRGSFDNLSVTGNIFANMVIEGETAKPTLMSGNAAAKKPTYMANNHFFNVSEGWFAVNAATYPELDFKAEATGNGGSVLEADPFVDAAKADFSTTLNAGAPKWRK